MPVTSRTVYTYVRTSVIARIFEHNSNGEIAVHSFLICVGQLKFRGTSGLLRLPKPLFSNQEGVLPDHRPPSPVQPPPEGDREDKTSGDNEQLRDSSEGTDFGEDSTLPTKVLHNRRRGALPDVDEEMEVSSLGEQATNCAPPKKKPQLSISLPTSRSADHNSHHLQQEKAAGQGATKHHHGEEEYSIATHFVKVRRNGLLVDVSTLWDFMATDAVTGSVRNILSHSRPGMQRQSSIFAFNPVSCT